MILAVVNQKGGVGKTTCANFLSKFSARDQETLVVDIDPQGDLTSCFVQSLPPEANVKRLWEQQKDGERSDNRFEPFTISRNLVLAGSDISLSYWENPASASVYFVLRGWFEDHPLPSDQWAIIDTPPNNGVFSTNALQVADFILIPVDASKFSLLGLTALFTTIKEVNRNFRRKNPLRVAGIVLSNVSQRLKFTQEITKELEKDYGPFIMKTVLPNSIRVREAIAGGKEIGDGPALSSYKELYEELKERIR